ncbi:uncharacterized protein LOC114239824 [Bombyx mandarina]|uniref:Uncharacterized protein LOC114239824 n=1 Tax=Bombyx mandarina TaxID=7092 RepID=A0A6J2JA79_BOMMA|nr:uncharacterized protein LOC114239824 [Bombyx mandarina]
MKICLVFVLFGCVCAWTSGMLYRRDADNVLKPDLLPVSSTVVPLPFYSVYGYEKKLLREKDKKRPEGKISLVTKQQE